MANGKREFVRITFRTDKKLKAEISRLAEAECRNLSQQVEYLLKIGLKQVSGGEPERGE